jgi:hypothetical protein
MWQRWQQFLRRPAVWVPLALSGLINVGAWILLLVTLKPQSQLIVLHYTVYFGVDRVGHWSEALAIPAVGLGLLVGNTVFAKLCHDRDLVFSHVFMFMTPLVEILLLAAAVFVVTANFPASI